MQQAEETSDVDNKGTLCFRVNSPAQESRFVDHFRIESSIRPRGPLRMHAQLRSNASSRAAARPSRHQAVGARRIPLTRSLAQSARMNRSNTCVLHCANNRRRVKQHCAHDRCRLRQHRGLRRLDLYTTLGALEISLPAAPRGRDGSCFRSNMKFSGRRLEPWLGHPCFEASFRERAQTGR